jgi:hypothetical protein
MGREDFGPRLRQEREWRGISLEELAVTTKVSIELWEAMERNDFSRWPSGVFARAFVRDYARAVGLDADAVVNDFCRYFPNGDRRISRIVRRQADLLGHPLQSNEAELLPAGRDRRKAPRSPASYPAATLYGPRAAAAAIDLIFVSLMSAAAAAFGAGFLTSAGVLAPIYFCVGIVGLGTSPGMRVIEAVRLRVPTLFASRRTVSA